jgi:hypothetical protein
MCAHVFRPSQQCSCDICLSGYDATPVIDFCLCFETEFILHWTFDL